MAEMEFGGGKFGARIWEAQCFLSHALLCAWVSKRKRGRLGSSFFFFFCFLSKVTLMWGQWIWLRLPNNKQSHVMYLFYVEFLFL